MKITKILIIIFVSFLLYNCAEKTIYSGKIINNNNFTYSHITNKNQLIDELGNSNYIDPIENKFYYFTEKRNYKNVFTNKIENRIIVVFSFDNNDEISFVERFELDDEKEIDFAKDETPNNIIKRGLIEKLFGGVSKTQIPNSSQ